MSKTGYRDKRTGEFVETDSHIANAVWKQQYNRGLYCVAGHYLKLLSTDGCISRDLSAFRWCCNCKSIPIRNIKLVLNRCCQTFKDVYRLHKLEHDIPSRNWLIESAEWISPNESRVNAHRKLLSQDEILSILKQAAEDSMLISFEKWTDLFRGFY
jgi:hypothetical protein